MSKKSPQKKDESLVDAYMDNLSKKGGSKTPLVDSLREKEEDVELAIVKKGLLNERSTSAEKMSRRMKAEKTELDNLTASGHYSGKKPLFTDTSSPYHKEMTKEEEKMLEDKREMREMERDYIKRKEAKATEFVEKMGKQTTSMERKRAASRTRLLRQAREFQAGNQKRREALIEELNKEKRVEIEDRLEALGRSQEERREEVRRKNQEFAFVKRNLSPTIDQERQVELERGREAVKEERLKARHEKYKPMDMDALLNHEANFTLSLKRREFETVVQTAAGGGTGEKVDPASFKKHKDNPFFQKKKNFEVNHSRSLKYAEAVKMKVNQRSPQPAILDWHSYQQKSNFGFFYKQEVTRRVEENKSTIDPNSFMVEGIERAKRNQMKRSAVGGVSQSMVSLRAGDSSTTEVRHTNYKEYLNGKIDFKKVNDEDVSNKLLNEFERAERAKKLIGQGNKKIHLVVSPSVTNVYEAASDCLNSKIPNIFKRYMGTLEHLERQAAEQEKLEKVIKNGGGSVVVPKAVDSIDLLSQSIQSKMDMLKSMDKSTRPSKKY